MRILVFVAFLLVTPATAIGDCGSCPPKQDWDTLGLLWRDFAADPTRESAWDIVDAFPVSDYLAVPETHESILEVMGGCTESILDLITQGEPGAIQLGLRLIRVLGYPDHAEMVSGVATLATSDPELFLVQLVVFSEANPCVVDLYSIVQYFGTAQEIRDHASPRLQDIQNRIEALASVGDRGLSETRDNCIGLLKVQESGILESPYPRLLRRVDVDFSEIRGRMVSTYFAVAEATVGIDGRVKRVRMLRDTDPLVQQAVERAIGQWVFEPKIENGEPVEFKYILTVRGHP